MKTNNKKKIVVSTLAIAMGAALVGSISGSVAWYQYSTRTTASMTATSAGTSRNLQVATSNLAQANADGWGYNVDASAIATLSGNADGDLTPTTPKTLTSGVYGTLASHPVYQYFTDWAEADSTADYIAFSLYFQSLNGNGTREDNLPIYLTALEINAGTTDVLADAIRVQITSGSSSILLSKNGGDTTTKGKLDLNGYGGNDKNGFAADDSDGEETDYIAGSVASYTSTAINSAVVDDSDPYALSGDAIATTSDTAAVKVDFLIWLEGWQEVGSPTASSIWDYDLVGETFTINMRFAVNAEK